MPLFKKGDILRSKNGVWIITITEIYLSCSNQYYYRYSKKDSKLQHQEICEVIERAYKKVHVTNPVGSRTNLVRKV